MKKLFFLLSAIFLLTGANAQSLTVGVDFYNRYVFRGIDFGSSPSLQPSIKFSTGNFTVGTWGAYSTGTGEFSEADLFASYNFDFGLTLGVTSYYFPGPSWFELDDEVSSHAVEINVAYQISDFSLSGNHIINNSSLGAGSKGGDTYFELGYSAGSLTAFLGAGDGWHTVNGNFQVVNVGIGASKEIIVTENFTVPMNGKFILNPNTEQVHLVVGVSF